MSRKKARDNPNEDVNGLTCIPHRIHCAATQEGGDELSEVDRISIEHFLETLAEVALSVASRIIHKNSTKDRLTE